MFFVVVCFLFCLVCVCRVVRRRVCLLIRLRMLRILRVFLLRFLLCVSSMCSSSLFLLLSLRMVVHVFSSCSTSSYSAYVSSLMCVSSSSSSFSYVSISCVSSFSSSSCYFVSCDSSSL